MDKVSLILKTDSYKLTQFLQYPKGTTAISSYISARKAGQDTVFVGPQTFIKENLLTPVTLADIEEAESYAMPHIGYFNKQGWLDLVNKHGGYAPMLIESVDEGTVMPPENVQLQAVNTDYNFAWLTGYLETLMLRDVWYMSTVATRSRRMKEVIGKALVKTSDVPVEDQINYKLHDFGARAATSHQSAMHGGLAHLVNFSGTDTLEGLVCARRCYNDYVAGHSIPASEHSTITSWGREHEEDAHKNMVEVFGGKGKLLASVSDSYDIYDTVRNIWGGSLANEVRDSGGTIVVRPDSGDPVEVTRLVIEILFEKFGYSVNSKGYKVLPDYIRVIQGGGVTMENLPVIIDALIAAGISIDNVAFGMGGALLQDVARNNLGYVMKASAKRDAEGVWSDVYKDPISGNKTSLKGRLGLINDCGVGSCSYRTVPKSIADKKGNLLLPRYHNGSVENETDLTSMRRRAAIDFSPKITLSRYE
jgi:nicotinamide phosphoribosyltransferase